MGLLIKHLRRIPLQTDCNSKQQTAAKSAKVPKAFLGIEGQGYRFGCRCLYCSEVLDPPISSSVPEHL